jgi:myo-inositol-1(or 4)-monophosphatase
MTGEGKMSEAAGAQDDLGQRLALAEDAARQAGALLMERLGGVRHIETKTSSKDLVTETDIDSGRLIVSLVLERFPKDAIVTEEPAALDGLDVAPPQAAAPISADATQAPPGSAAAAGPEFTWVIDPLDGTTSYVHTFPYFAVSVAVLQDGVPAAGVVYAPVADECFTAMRGSGACLNGTPLATSGRSSVDEALLVTGFAYDRGWPLERQIRILYALLARVHGVRRNGAAALDLCQVAAGRADGYWELEMKDWDLAAGAVILREGGGRITGFDGQDWVPGVKDVVATNGPLHTELLDAVTKADIGPVPHPIPPL